MITIVDYSAGNPTSVQRALAAVGVKSQITSDPEAIRDAQRVIFPGVGHAESTMKVLVERGLDTALRDVAQRGTPLLGICVGGQVMLETSDESKLPCLGLIRGRVQKFPPMDRELKIPHMGWNRVVIQKNEGGLAHPVFQDLPKTNELYFVHSYYMAPSRETCILGRAEHGIEFVCAMGQDNMIALQFHPEKSGPMGLNVLKRFAEWEPSC